MNKPKRVGKHPRIALGAIAFLLLLAFTLYHHCGFGGCPNVDQLAAYQPGGQSILYDAHGRRFADLTPVQHAVVKLGSLPSYVPAAFVAVEDKRFYEHHGVDKRRVLGALFADIKSLSFKEGFSTITMQIAGTIWHERVPRTKKTLGRKFIEIRLAREIEHKYPKKEILELYLNNIYFGGGAYGVEAAARNYFGKSARNLTLQEAALLAALPKSPSIYDPRRSSARARHRRDLVLARMAQQGKITEVQHQRARGAGLAVRRDPPARRNPSLTAPYFVEAIRRILEERFGEDLYTTPLRVYTTLDRDAQRAAEEELTRQLRAVENGALGKYKGKHYSAKGPVLDETAYIQGAVVLMDARNGGVLAHVGGRDFRQSRFDRVTRAKRQAGSAFKPFVYAAALSEGYAPSQHISDKPLRMELPNGEVWEPRNFTNDFDSITTLRHALVQSRNIPTIRLAADVGLHDVARVARQSGISSTIPETPAMAIGTASVTPIELTRAYTPFANLGSNVQPRWIDRVEDEKGNVLWKPEVKKSEVLDRGVAFLVTDMLREAVSKGTGTAVRRVGFTGVAAGKTGTTNDATDVWFVGYTPDLVGAVWIGFDDPKPIVHDASGGRIAAPVWGRIMRRVYTTRTRPQVWKRPDNIEARVVDPASGLLLVAGCSPIRGSGVYELFLKYAEPAATCPRGKPIHKANIFDHAIGWLRGAWRDARRWLASHVGREAAPPRPRGPRYLGVPRLPEAEDMEAPDEDTDTMMMDSMPMDIPPIDPETVSTDTARDLEEMDTTSGDTLDSDTSRVSTLFRRASRSEFPRRSGGR